MMPRLAKLGVPTLVVVGAEDAITPVADMQEMAQGIAGAEFVVIPNAGHMTALEAPIEFNTVLARFLATRVLEQPAAAAMASRPGRRPHRGPGR